jgi:hypothetical protein
VNLKPSPASYKGLELRALRHFSKGDYVGPYLGDIVSKEDRCQSPYSHGLHSSFVGHRILTLQSFCL